MLAKHRKQGTYAVVTFFLMMVVLAGVMPQWPQVGKPFLVVGLASFWFAFWAFARAKGYSGFYGLVLAFLSLVGLVILIRLPDRHARKVASVGAAAQQGTQADRPASGGPAA